jgi:hypothetical protein
LNTIRKSTLDCVCLICSISFNVIPVRKWVPLAVQEEDDEGGVMNVKAK